MAPETVNLYDLAARIGRCPEHVRRTARKLGIVPARPHEYTRGQAELIVVHFSEHRRPMPYEIGM